MATVDPTCGGIGLDKRNISSPAPKPAIIAPRRLADRASISALIARKGSIGTPRRTLVRTGQAKASAAAAMSSSKIDSTGDGENVARPSDVNT